MYELRTHRTEKRGSIPTYYNKKRIERPIVEKARKHTPLGTRTVRIDLPGLIEGRVKRAGRETSLWTYSTTLYILQPTDKGLLVSISNSLAIWPMSLTCSPHHHSRKSEVDPSVFLGFWIRLLTCDVIFGCKS